jgi:hypothetical protein
MRCFLFMTFSWRRCPLGEHVERNGNGAETTGAAERERIGERASQKAGEKEQSAEQEVAERERGGEGAG